MIINENDFKVKMLNDWGFKKYTLDEDRVDIKLKHIWIETKQKSEDIYDMLAQAIFTAYKVKGYRELPIYFACFNANNGAIIENYQVQDIFAHTDINWTQTPSKLDKKTVERIKYLLKEVKEYSLEELGKRFKEIEEKGNLAKKQINKNNFLIIYNEWLEAVGNDINEAYFNGEESTKADCYFADLMSDSKGSIAQKLRIVLSKNFDDYCYKKVISTAEQRAWHEDIEIKDQKKYVNFWSKYERPPALEYQEYILNRRDLLQAQNVREIRGAFFTPKIWCDKSKDYLSIAFGENWQDEYYIWDCCCGTGNLERGLINQDRVFMSTLDNPDLDIIKQLNFMPDSVKFQFDFLNDDWLPVSEGGKIPNSLFKIIKNEPQKLIIYINPPYFEAANNKRILDDAYKSGSTKTNLKAQMIEKGMGKASNELFAQFYFRIYKEIPSCKIGSFSKLKNCSGANFESFRKFFKAKFCGGFVCRANTFDNVSGSFPISFQTWDCAIKEDFKQTLEFDILENDGNFSAKKEVYNFANKELINGWFKTNNQSSEEVLCYISKHGNDFQNQNDIALYLAKCDHSNKVTKSNLIISLIYFSVRLCIPATWLNDRDQFTHPTLKLGDVFDDEGARKYEYETDENFINNCIVFALFKKNNTNWQIFPNSQIGLNSVERDMTIYNMLLKNKTFTEEAESVLAAAREIYKMYHIEFPNNPNASWYEVCKGLKESKNIIYKEESRPRFIKLMNNLGMEIASDVYKYGFLK